MSATPPSPEPIVPTAELKLQATVPQFSTIQEAKANGAVVGSALSAPLAPATGPITGKAESLVVVTVKTFFGSPTGKAVVAVLSAALFAVLIAFSAALLAVWSAGKSIFDTGAIDWRTTERVCEIAGGMALVGGLMGLMRKHDNNAVKS